MYSWERTRTLHIVLAVVWAFARMERTASTIAQMRGTTETSGAGILRIRRGYPRSIHPAPAMPLRVQDLRENATPEGVDTTVCLHPLRFFQSFAQEEAGMRFNAIRILSLGLLFTLVACTAVDESEAETVLSGQDNTKSAITSPSPTSTSTLTPTPSATTPFPATNISTPTPSPSATSISGDTPLTETQHPLVTGQVVQSYGRHDPMSGLPLWVAPRSSGYPADATTNDDGRFQLTDLPIGETITINVGPHLSFQLRLTTSQQTVDLGVLKYPLIHPPNMYYWTPYVVRDLTQLTSQGEKLPFAVCKHDASWQRPTEEEQREYVWSKSPFREREVNYLQSRFQDSAILYNSVDFSHQVFTDGLRLDDLGAERTYLSGLWTAASSPIELSDCSYTPEVLKDLFERRQIEVWLLGYRATEVHVLSTEDAELDEDTLCDSRERICTARHGYHYAVDVQPAAGYQVIRFDGHQSVMTVHVMAEGKEIAQLP